MPQESVMPQDTERSVEIWFDVRCVPMILRKSVLDTVFEQLHAEPYIRIDRPAYLTSPECRIALDVAVPGVWEGKDQEILEALESTVTRYYTGINQPPEMGISVRISSCVGEWE